MDYVLIISMNRHSGHYAKQKDARHARERPKLLFDAHWTWFGPTNDKPREIKTVADLVSDRSSAWYKFVIDPVTSNTPLLNIIRSDEDNNLPEIFDALDVAAKNAGERQRVLFLQNGIDGSTTIPGSFDDVTSKWRYLQFDLAVVTNFKHKTLQMLKGLYSVAKHDARLPMACINWVHVSLDRLVRIWNGLIAVPAMLEIDLDMSHQCFLYILTVVYHPKLGFSIQRRIKCGVRAQSCSQHPIGRQMFNGRNTFHLGSYVHQCCICDADNSESRWRRRYLYGIVSVIARDCKFTAARTNAILHRSFGVVYHRVEWGNVFGQ